MNKIICTFNAASRKVVVIRPNGPASPKTYSTALNITDGIANGFKSYLVIYPAR